MCIRIPPATWLVAYDATAADQAVNVCHQPQSGISCQTSRLVVMPWPWFKNMTEYELTAMYEYLRAIPCIGSEARCGE